MRPIVLNNLRRATSAIALVLFVLPACGDPTSTSQSYTFKFLVNTMTAGTSASSANALGTDLDGDGLPDNQFGQVIAVLASQGLAADAALNAGIANGSLEHLIRLTSHDTTLTTDGDATVQFSIAGAGAAFPGPYAPEAGNPPAIFRGTITGGSFASADPRTTTTPVSVSLRVVLFGGTPIDLPISGGSLRFTADATGSPRLLNGKISGALTVETISNFVYPSMAQGLNATVQANPTSADAQTILSLFDKGGCAGGTANDKAISVCEVSTNSLMVSLFAPDVQLLANGTFATNPAGPSLNALSIAFGFAAQLTTF